MTVWKQQFFIPGNFTHGTLFKINQIEKSRERERHKSHTGVDLSTCVVIYENTRSWELLQTRFTAEKKATSKVNFNTKKKTIEFFVRNV